MKTGITLAFAALGAIGGTSLLSGFHMPLISANYTPPGQCVEWYDGCNMCDKTATGSICTDRSCATPGRGFCREYATSTSQTT